MIYQGLGVCLKKYYKEKIKNLNLIRWLQGAVGLEIRWECYKVLFLSKASERRGTATEQANLPQ